MSMIRKLMEHKIRKQLQDKETSTNNDVGTSEEVQVVVEEEPVVEKSLESERVKEVVVEKSVVTKSRGRQVICLTTGEIFNSITQAKQKYKGSIDRACQGKQKTAGVHPETGEKLRWMYYDEYLSGSDVQ